jgi:hypothetical protein
MEYNTFVTFLTPVAPGQSAPLDRPMKLNTLLLVVAVVVVWTWVVVAEVAVLFTEKPQSAQEIIV